MSNDSQSNKALIRHILTEVDRGNLDILDEHPGLRDGREFHAARIASLTDSGTTIEEQIAEGEWVATRLINRAVHTGPWMGLPPTGRELTIEVLLMHRVVDGKVVQEHSQADVPSVMRQLDILPAQLEM